MIWCLLVRQYKWFYSTVNFFCGLLTKFQIWNTFFVRGSISCRPIKQTKTVNFLMLKCERNFRIWNCINLVYILLYNLASFIIFDFWALICCCEWITSGQMYSSSAWRSNYETPLKTVKHFPCYAIIGVKF